MDAKKQEFMELVAEVIGNEGLKSMVAAAKLGFCPFCKEPVIDNFRDEESRREFEISGICQKCQDGFFGR